MDVNNILLWLKNIIITIPDGIVQSLIIGIIGFTLRYFMGKIPTVGLKISNFFREILNFFNTNSIEISDTTTIIPTPKYIPGEDFIVKARLRRRKPSRQMSDNDFWGMIIMFLFVAIIVVGWFMKHKNEISLVMKWFGVIPLVISIAILVVIAISGRIQKATLIYLFYSIPISILTIYYGVNLLKMSEGMSTVLKDGALMRSLYIIIGLFISVLQQLIVYIMVLRNGLIHVARKKTVPKFIKKFIYDTSFFESQISLIIMIVIFSSISYLLTSGLLISWIQNIN